LLDLFHYIAASCLEYTVRDGILNGCGTFLEKQRQSKPELQEKPVKVPLNRPQIPRGPGSAQTRTTAARSR